MNDISLAEEPTVLERDGNRASIEIAGLYPGYGVTLGNALRRVLLSSLPGAAVTTVTFQNVPHEFSAIPGIKESALDLVLNMKQLRLKLFSDEPQTLTLKAKGEGEVLAKDLEAPAQVQIVSEDLSLATLTAKKAELNLELHIEHGIGYVPAEERKKEKMPIGSIAVDAIFTPVTEVNFTVENMRVGDRTDYNRLVLDIETDGTMEPEEALARAADILVKQFSAVIPGEFAHVTKETDSGTGESALLGEPLATIGLTGSVVSKLEDEDVRNVGDLIRRTRKELEDIKGVGEKAVDGIEESLKKLELSLAEPGAEDADEEEEEK